MSSFMHADDFENDRTHHQGETLVQRHISFPATNGSNGHFDMKNCILPNGLHINGDSKNHYLNGESKIRSSMPRHVTIKDGQQKHRHHHHKHHNNKGKIRKEVGRMDRFSRTAAVLHQAGLMKLTLQISQLLKTNEELQKEIDNLQRESLQFSENLKTQLQEKLEHVNGNIQEKK